MSLIYITGPSGAGKSTVAEELELRGFEAHDSDKEFCAWYDNATDEQVEYPRFQADRAAGWEEKHSFRMSAVLVKELASRAAKKPIYLCGNALYNDLAIADQYFDTVICLLIDEDVMIQRVSTRTNNSYGNDPDQQAIMRKWYQPLIDRYKNYGAIMVDGNRPTNQVVDDILSLTVQK